MSITDEPAVTRRDRTITARWVIGERTDDYSSADRVEDTVALRVAHLRDRKQLVATLQPEVLEHHETHTVHRFGLFGGVRVAARPVARFSRKQLEGFFGEALDLARELGGDDRVAAMFEGSEA